MNLSSINAIYNDVGSARCKAMLIPKEKKEKSTRPITEKTINIVSEIIRKHKTPTRNYIMRKSHLSSSTVSNAIGVLFSRKVIVKNASSDTGRTVTYSTAKK